MATTGCFQLVVGKIQHSSESAVDEADQPPASSATVQLGRRLGSVLAYDGAGDSFSGEKLLRSPRDIKTVNESSWVLHPILFMTFLRRLLASRKQVD